MPAATIFLVLSMGGSAVVGAQKTGGISGIVRDPTGAVLPDCLVTATSMEGVGARRQRTGSAGAYAFSGLAVGSYRVELDRAGFEKAVVAPIVVGAGTHVELDVTLELGDVAGAVEVRASIPAIDRKRTGRSERLDRAHLERVPSGRSLWSVLEQTPGLVTDRFDVGGSASGQQSLFSAAGTAYAQNQYYVNGVNATDPAALGASSAYYAFESFEEIQVSSSGHSAEIQAPGVFLNIVLENGSTRFRGGASHYFENEALQSDNLDGALRARGVSQSNALDSYADTHLELGGPILPDRAFFYASFARQRNDPYVIGFFLPSGEPGIDSTDLKTLLGRGTLELGRTGSASFLFFRNGKLRPHREAGRFRPSPATALHQDSTTDIVQALYSRTFGDDLLFDARFSIVNLDFPLGERPDLPPDSFSRIELSSGVRQGGPGTNELYRRDRYQGNASLFFFVDDWVSGSHDLKLGWEQSRSPTSTRYDLMGAILYRDLFGIPLQVEIYGEPLTAENHASNLGAFVQDSYVLGRLVLDLGVRFDRWSAGYPDQSRPEGPWEAFFRSRGLPETTGGRAEVVSFHAVAPRLGFTYALTADGRTVLRGSYGRYAHQIGTGLAAFVNRNARASALLSFADENGNRVVDPGEVDLASPLAVSLPATNEIDDALEQPRTDEVTIGLERELFSGLVVSASALYRKDHHLFDDVNLGVPTSEYVESVARDPGRDLAVGTADDGLVPVFNQSRESLGDDRFRLTNPPGLESRYRGLSFEARKRYAGRWQMLVSLTLSESEGYLPGPGLETEVGASASTPLFDDPNSLTNARGRTYWDRPRILRASGSYEVKWGLLVGAAYRYQTGKPLYRSIQVGETVEGEPLAQGPIEILAEPQGAVVQPAVHILDLRAEKGFDLRGLGEIDVVFDLFNALNANTATEVAARRGAFGAILEILPPRVARIGLRYRFGSRR